MAGLEKLRFLEKKTFLGFTGHRRPDTKLRQKRNKITSEEKHPKTTKKVMLCEPHNVKTHKSQLKCEIKLRSALSCTAKKPQNLKFGLLSFLKVFKNLKPGFFKVIKLRSALNCTAKKPQNIKFGLLSFLKVFKNLKTWVFQSNFPALVGLYALVTISK